MLLQINEPSQPSLPSVDAATFSVGIDLGTTLSAVAVLQNGVPRVLHLPEGRLIPSAVFLSAEGAITVGHQALARQGQAGELILSIKRLMGTPHGHTFSSAQGEKTWSPAEISAEILKHLKSQAEEVLGGRINNAVITVPAYFDEAARTATKQAAHLAGLHVLRLLSEPTAAALAYGLDHPPKGAYAVYDLGGGTFDISILRPHTGVLQVIATAGNTALGGDDFDERLYALLKTRDHTPLPPFTSSLQLISRHIKEKLSTQDTVDYSFSHDGIAFEGSVARQSFEAAIAPLVDQTLAVAAQALRDAALSPLEISQIVLVGGSSRIPFVQQQVEAFFKKKPLCALNPDEAVALGAGMQAAALTQGSQTLLLDVIPISLGLETMGGLAEKIVHRNTPIPTVQEQDFTTYQDGQTALLIHVVQGEREFAAHCRSIARFTLSGIPPLAAGCAHIRVTFAVDADGLLTVTAQETKTGVSQRVEVQPTYGLTEDDMMRLLAEGMRHAQDDMALRKLTEAQVDARRLIQALEGALNQDGHLLKADVHAALVAGMGILAQATHGHDSAVIRKQMKKVENLSQAFAEARINQAMGKALTGHTIDTVSSVMSKISSESDWQDGKSQV